MSETLADMKITSLLRSVPYWILIVLSLASAGVGGWLSIDQITTMTSTLLDNTATGVEVYAGQAWAVVGAALLGAGILGILLAFFLGALRALLPVSAPVVVESIDWKSSDEEDEGIAVAGSPDATAGAEGASVVKIDFANDEAPAESATATPAETPSDHAAVTTEPGTDDQNGSSGSTATATNINVK